MDSATRVLSEKGYRMLVANRTEPWGQTVTRLLSPEGLLTGLTITPWLRGLWGFGKQHCGGKRLL